MSRLFKMQLTAAVPMNKFNQVDGIIGTLWDWDYVSERGGELIAEGDDYLCGGKSDEEFAIELSDAIQEITGEETRVVITSTYMEDLPTETFTYGTDKAKEKQ